MESAFHIYIKHVKSSGEIFKKSIALFLIQIGTVLLVEDYVGVV